MAKEAWERRRVLVERDEDYEWVEWRLSSNVLPNTDALRWLAKVAVLNDHGGHEGQSFRFYLMNPRTQVLIHPYDDRGADVYASTVEELRPFYNRFGAWLLDQDRSGADEMMSGGQLPSWPDPLA